MNPQQSRPLYDFERTAPPPRIHMNVCGRCGTWKTPMAVREDPCLKDGTPHVFEGHWYVHQDHVAEYVITEDGSA